MNGFQSLFIHVIVNYPSFAPFSSQFLFYPEITVLYLVIWVTSIVIFHINVASTFFIEIQNDRNKKFYIYMYI